jgi:hypothetical protein
MISLQWSKFRGLINNENVKEEALQNNVNIYKHNVKINTTPFIIFSSILQILNTTITS